MVVVLEEVLRDLASVWVDVALLQNCVSMVTKANWTCEHLINVPLPRDVPQHISMIGSPHVFFSITEPSTHLSPNRCETLLRPSRLSLQNSLSSVNTQVTTNRSQKLAS